MQTSPERPDEADEHQQQTVTREIAIDADPETVWEAVSTSEGRERWIEADPDRVVIVDHEQPPNRVSWWWWSSEGPARHVDVRVIGIPTGTRVIVTETAPATMPVAQLSACCAPVLVAA